MYCFTRFHRRIYGRLELYINDILVMWLFFFIKQMQRFPFCRTHLFSEKIESQLRLWLTLLFPWLIPELQRLCINRLCWESNKQELLRQQPLFSVTTPLTCSHPWFRSVFDTFFCFLGKPLTMADVSIFFLVLFCLCCRCFLFCFFVFVF